MNLFVKLYLAIFFIALLILSPRNAFSQIQVYQANNNSFYKHPWAGGMNSCQFNEIDMNFDGIKDLLVFDRTGNRLLPFINSGISDSIDYVYAPQLAGSFPEIYDWLILRDYNLDGREDIFCYSKGFAGMLVYKNISDGDMLKFELMVYPFLTSLQGSIYTNILVTNVDYPGVIDLDDDGDLDILTFWGLGSFVELHQNMSMEKYGVPDSLDYKKVQFCWGEFAESDESNHIYLDTCNSDRIAGNLEKERHTGSTFLLNDMNGNGSMDLVLGDVDYPGMVELTNGGTSFDAFMTGQNWNFPEGTKKVDLFAMPVAALIDINNDLKNDLIVSPFDPGLYKAQNYTSSWLYMNKGENNNPELEFASNDFLQSQMIDLGSGAYPVFFDFNNDGLKDLLVGNYGYYDSSWYDEWYSLHTHYTAKLAAFENIGNSTEPAFELYDRNYTDLSEKHLLGIVPCFYDLDGDNDKDMLVGNENGDLLYYQNIAGPGEEAQFLFQDDHYQGIDVGEFSSPQLFDLNEDNLPDLIIGEKKGNLNYYRNTGSISHPQFEYITDSLGKINVTDYNVSNNGYSVPHFFNILNGDIRLIVGSEQGKLFYYKDIRDNLQGKFTESDSLPWLVDTIPFDIKPGIRSAAAITDLNQDGWMDLIAGNFAGGMNYYAMSQPDVGPSVEDISILPGGIRIFPNPAHHKFQVILPELVQKEIKIEILDLLGRKQEALIMPSGLREFVISTINFEPGIYLVRFQMDSQIITIKKIIILSGL